MNSRLGFRAAIAVTPRSAAKGRIDLTGTLHGHSLRRGTHESIEPTQARSSYGQSPLSEVRAGESAIGKAEDRRADRRRALGSCHHRRAARLSDLARRQADRIDG